ncbi:hypothetical protein JNK13_01150 [bacterium]|nr:hypothetical protein [bacterium]
MDKSESVRQLGEAIDLLGMVEYLLDRAPRENLSTSGGLPWGGIKLTLRQSKQAVMEAREKLSRDSRYESIIAPSLSDRVQQIPTGRAREIVADNVKNSAVND